MKVFKLLIQMFCMNMKTKMLIGLFVVTILAGVTYLLNSSFVILQNNFDEEENKEQQALFSAARIQYEYDLVKDPKTGKIPVGIREAETEQAFSIPNRMNGGISNRSTLLNTYLPAGPNNIGGRTRALAYDIRYNGTSNQVILSGSVSGGIMRSTDGGTTWNRVSPDNDIHNLTSIAQDTRPGFQDTWYAGGGEPIGNSASEGGAIFYGDGIFKSINNGLSWTKLPLNTIVDSTASPVTTLSTFVRETFDHTFDFVHKIMVNKTNGDLYVAGHRRIVRSKNGGNNFTVVFGGTGTSAPALITNGQMDIAQAADGKLFVSVNGGNPLSGLRGIWTSTSGNLNNWNRIAGGSALGTDSVAGWNANSFNTIANSNQFISKRIILAPAPSNANILYVCYENGLSNTTPDTKPEADLFKLDMNGGVNAWTNLSANVPNFGKNNPATDPFAIQEGFNLMVTVKPDNPNMVFLGGTSLYRSTDGFATSTNTSWIGGYSFSTTSSSLSTYSNSHPDIHNLVFNPVNFNEALCANDGGIQRSTNINTATSGQVLWTMINNYQTLQYFFVGIDPTANQLNFIGGAQDNGTYFRQENSTPAVSNSHFKILGGDGCATGIASVTNSAFKLYGSSQYGRISRDITNVFTTITPTGLTAATGLTDAYGEFVTNFKLNPDNTEDLYYVNFSRLFRTTNATTVTPSTWTEITAVNSAINPTSPTSVGIRAMGFSRGPYTTSHVLYLGTTNGKIFRLIDPRNTLSTSNVRDITPADLIGNVQDIAVNPNNDDEIMAIVSNYNAVSIWFTKNAKSNSPTWLKAEGNLTLPSYRSCMIVVKKDALNNPVTEYYVGTSVGLYSAENIGSLTPSGDQITVNWQREGGSILNFAVVTALAYRPTDNVLLVGTHGNGMYYSVIGNPNFTPNQNTGINDPILNDKRFINAVFPTLSNSLIDYRIGNLYTVKRISVLLTNINGQQVYRNESGYQNGSIQMSSMPKGLYILSISSDDQKYKHVQKIVKQ